MRKDTKWTRLALGATIGTTLVLALAAAGSATPLQDRPSVLRAAHAAPLEVTAPGPDGAPEPTPAEVADAAAAASTDPGQAADAAGAPGDDAGSPDVAGPAPVGAAPAAPPPAPPAPPAVSTPAPTPGAPTAPVEQAQVARRQPSPAEVQQALDGLDPFVDSILTPSAAQVQEAGDKVCAAFDEGQTFAQVKATARELVSRVPLTTVHAGADDYVVRTVVGLYCPGHGPKLV